MVCVLLYAAPGLRRSAISNVALQWDITMPRRRRTLTYWCRVTIDVWSGRRCYKMHREQKTYVTNIPQCKQAKTWY